MYQTRFATVTFNFDRNVCMNACFLCSGYFAVGICCFLGCQLHYYMSN